MNSLTFADLIDTKSLQMMQDSFSRFTGLALCVFDAKGNPVVKSSGSTDFCEKFTKCTEKGLALCNEFDKNGIIKSLDEGKSSFQTCHAGLTSFVIPIIFDGRIIGSIMGGQVHTDDIDYEKIRQKASELGIDQDKYVEAAKKTAYMSNEQVQKIVDFLSDFSNALSVMAYSNFMKISASRKMERSARSQANLITDITKELSVTMREWLDDFRAATRKYEGITEITYETDALLSKGQEVYAVIDGAIDYIRVSGGDVEYSENVYETQRFFKNCLNALEKDAKKNNIKITHKFDSSIPESLVGNSGRIGQVIIKTGSNIICNTKENGEFIISASCMNTTYSCALIIELTGIGLPVQDEIIEKYQKIIKSGGANMFNKENNSKSGGFDLPLIVLLVKQMSGKIKLTKSEDDRITFTLTIPQLDGNK